MRCRKDDFRVAMRVRGMDVAPDHVVVHQSVDHVGCLAFGGRDHRGVPQQMAHNDETDDADAFVFA